MKDLCIAVSGKLADQIGTAGLGRLCQIAADLTLVHAVTLTVAGPSEHHKGREITKSANPNPPPKKPDTEMGLRDIETHARAIAKLVAELAP